MSRDSRLEESVGRVLRVGVVTSAVCLVAGLGLSTFAGAGRMAHRLLDVGLIILMATPVGRVVISVVEYVIERDWWFVLLTTIVLLEVLAGVVAAFR